MLCDQIKGWYSVYTTHPEAGAPGHPDGGAPAETGEIPQQMTSALEAGEDA